MTTTETTVPAVPQIINPECSYTPLELAARLGCERSTILEWGNESDPLPILRRGRSKVMIIRGRDFIEWYARTPQGDAQ